MSLTAILKKIEKVNQKHRQIQQRFNSSSKGCPRQLQLQQQSQQDQRIYGYSNAQILNLFKQNSKSILAETRPTTAEPYGYQSKQLVNNQNKRTNIRRVQSATKPVVCYKQQYNFLFKEDIFDSTYEKNIKSPVFRQLKFNNQRLSQKFKDTLKKNGRRGRGETAQEQKRQFIRTFEDNLQRMKNNSQQKFIFNKRCSKQITYDKRESVKVQKSRGSQDVELFKLTKPEFSHYLHTYQIKFTQSANNIQEIKRFLGKNYESKISMEDKKSILPFENFYEQLIPKLPPKFTLTFLAVPSLKSVKLNLMVKNEQLLVIETKQLVDLQSLIDNLLNQHGFIHLCFHDKSQLIYEVFMLGKNLLSSQIVENETLLLSYYLQRFLLLDKTTSIKVAQETAQLIFKTNIDIPDQFFDFVTSFKNKCCHFYDKESRYYTLRLKDIINNGIRAVVAFKRQLGLGQKVVKLKNGTKKEMKNYIYNWAYFYICFSNIMNTILIREHSIFILIFQIQDKLS